MNLHRRVCLTIVAVILFGSHLPVFPSEEGTLLVGRIAFVEPKTAVYQEKHKFFLGGAIEKHYLVLELLTSSTSQDCPSRVLLGIDVDPPRPDLCDMDTRLLRLDRWHQGDYVIAFSYEASRVEDGSCSLPWVLLGAGEATREHPALKPYLELPLYCTRLGSLLHLNQSRGDHVLSNLGALAVGSKVPHT